VTITTEPVLAEIDDVISCGSYILPTITGVTYYNTAGATGSAITSVSETQTVYAFAQGTIPECSAEQSFLVTINVPPTLAAIADVTSCGTYTLPTIEGVVYYNAAGATGAAITSVPSTQTVYAYKAGATADCSVEQSFTVTITTAPTLAEIDDVISCESYELPVVQGVTYYNGPGATAGAITSVSDTKTVYAYMAGATADCFAEQGFTVMVTDAPQLEITGGCDGNDYILDVAVLNGNAQLDYTYEWTSIGGNILSGENSASVTVSGEGTYSVTVTLTQPDCNGQAQTLVGHTNCMIQKGISVNGDGKNDFFDLEGFGVQKLEIFNRYGMKVYELSPYTNQWHGQSDKGEQLPDGTYYYVIGFDNGEPVRTGWIYLNTKN
jgi:gliding motility-associated-like protein